MQWQNLAEFTRMSTRPRILLDCDPGIDDVFAILCALRFADLAAITTVSGNVPLEHTTRNACSILDLAGVTDVPVHRGAARPLIREPAYADHIHGPRGLGEFQASNPHMTPSKTPALDAILSHSEAGDATIVAIGPLTNVAEALRQDPTLAHRINYLHWMGGSATRGNVTSHSEFNAWVDPEAAAVVFESGTRVVMYGLDLTQQVRLGDADIETLRSAATPTSNTMAELLEFYARNASSDASGKAIHDPCAVLGTTNPDLFDSAESRIVIDTGVGEKRGRSKVHPAEADNRHTHVVKANSEKVRALILEAAIDPGAPR